jgi:hypothetical protein
MINVEMQLPEFSKGVYRSLSDKSIPQITLSHTAFDRNEYELFGSAIKYCFFKRINMIILGEKRDGSEIEVEAVEYSTKDVKKLGKRVKDLANDYMKIYLLADYSNICLNCGEQINKNMPKEFGDNNYWHKQDGVEFGHNFTEEYMESALENLNKNNV